MNHRRSIRCLPSGLFVVFALILVGAVSPVSADPPTVNGLFYGDGDNARYVEYATSYLGSKLYLYFDAPTATLYTALVVSTTVNDNVFGQPDGRKQYMSSVGWGNGGGQQRGADKLVDSEYAQFTFACAPGSASSWTWNQGHACLSGGRWVTDMSCATSSGTAPPGYVSASSFAWNINAYEDASEPKPWDRDVVSDQLQDWVSPFDNTDPPFEALGLDGYPSLEGAGFSTQYQWEWRMVYEWSVPLGAGGAGCGGNLLYVVTGLSHHSPLKEELGLPPEECGDPENDCFPGDLTTADPLSDWGDLPDVYGTTAAGGGPFHNVTITGPYLGQEIVFDPDGQPSIDGLGDGAEEDGVTAIIDGAWTAGSPQTISVEVSNASAGTLVGAWFDWNGDGDLADGDEFFWWPVSDGTNLLPITVGSEFDCFNDTLHARFRLFSSGAAAPGGSLDQTDTGGEATDGEVEDYVWDPGVLPVTLNAFSSDGAAGGEITVRWQTASETDNVGFELWGLVEGRWQALGEFVPSRSTDSRLPTDYEIVIAAPSKLSMLQLVDYNSRGVIEEYGPFRIGARHGEVQPTQRIDWTDSRLEREQRLRARGFLPVGDNAAIETASPGEPFAGKSAWKHIAEGAPEPSSPAAETKVRTIELTSTRAAAAPKAQKSVTVDEGRQTHAAVSVPGVQRITYEALRDGGLDLAGVPNREIAVTWRGSPVARWIDSQKVFGPGSAIEFVGHPPEGDDALYISANNYQISVNHRLARKAKTIAWANIPQASPWYSKTTTIDRPILHHSQSPTSDPWIERTVLARDGVPATVTLEIDVVDQVFDGNQKLVLDLGTITDLPDITGAGGTVVPEHNVEVWFSGPASGFVPVTTASISGQQRWQIEADLPAGMLETGLNRIELRFETDYLFSLIVIDKYSLHYPTPYRGPILDFAPDRKAHGYRIDGFESPNVVAYSQLQNGTLIRHQTSVFPEVDGYTAEFRQPRVVGSESDISTAAAGRFWVTEAPHAPAVFTTQAPGDLFSEQSDLVVIAESSFVDTPALGDYLANKADFDPVVIDVEDIYNAVGYGMALPSAITDYLAARHELYPFSHVQLVGTDCYDRRNFISQCVSFVPLPTAHVGPTLYSPSQNRLVDFDRDEIADVAIGQFSVRTEEELATIVGKESSWYGSGLSSGDTALFIAEESDGKHDFLAQVNRVGRHLDASTTDILDMSTHPNIDTAREALRTSLDAGRAITVFSGHSSAVVWAYRGLLTSSSAAGLTNIGLPTIMLPLACETSYDISPTANVLGHQLLFSGENGALALSGAVSLANLDDNERMAIHVLDGLDSGMTLGQAVQAGREALGSEYQELQDNWLTQGDVTLRMER